MSAKVNRISVTIDANQHPRSSISKMTIRTDRVVGLVELKSGHVVISVDDIYGNISSWYIEEDYQTVFTQIESFDII